MSLNYHNLFGLSYALHSPSSPGLFFYRLQSIINHLFLIKQKGAFLEGMKLECLW